MLRQPVMLARTTGLRPHESGGDIRIGWFRRVLALCILVTMSTAWARAADQPVKLTGPDREPFVFSFPSTQVGISPGDQPQRVFCVASSPTGNFFAAGNEDHHVRIYHADTGELVRILRGHTAAVNGLTFSPDGTTLVSASSDHTLQQWEAETGKLLQTLNGHTKPVTSVAFSPSGKLLVSGSEDNSVKVWNITSGSVHQTLHGPTAAVRSVAFSPDGSRCASAGDDRSIRIWDTENWAESAVLNRHAGPVRCIRFAPNGKTLVSCSEDKSIRIWDIALGTEDRQLPNLDDTTWSLAFSATGSTMVSGGADKKLYIWDYEGGYVRQILPAHEAGITGVAFLPKSGTLVAGSHDRLVTQWNNFPSGQTPLAILLGHTGILRFVRFSPNGQYLVTGGHDSTATVWDMRTGSIRHGLKGHTGGVTSAAISPNGKLLATGSWDKTLRIWSLGTGEQLTSFPISDGEVRAVTFAPDNQHLAYGGADKLITILNVSTGSEVGAYLAKGPINGLAYSPSGKVLAAATGQWGDKAVQGELIMLDARNGKALSIHQPHTTGEISDISFSPDGGLLATTGADSTARILDGNTFRVKRVMNLGSGGYAASLLPDPDWVSVAEWSGRVTLWNTRRGGPYAVYTGHDADQPGTTRSSYSVVCSPDGTLLASAGCDHSVRLWPTGLTNTRIADPATTSVALVRNWTGGAVQSTVRLSATISPPPGGVGREIQCLAVAPDNDRVAIAGKSGALSLARSSTSQMTDLKTGLDDAIGMLSFPGDGQRLALGGPGKVAGIWEMSGPSRIAGFNGDKLTTDAVCYVPGSDTLVTGNGGGQVFLHDGTTGAVRTKLESGRGAVTALEVSRDWKMCVAGHADSWITLWDLSAGKLLQKWKTHVEPLTAVTCSPDGRLVATGAASTDPHDNLKIWDTSNSNRITTLAGHSTPIRALRFAPKGDLLASLSTDGKLLVWNLKTGAVLSAFNRPKFTALAWGPQGSSLFVVHTDGTLWRFDVIPTDVPLILGGLRAESDLPKYISERAM